LAPCAVLKERSAALRVPARGARLPVSAPLGVAQPTGAPSRQSYHAVVVLSTLRPWASAASCRVGLPRAVACEAERGRYSALLLAVNLVTWRRAQCHRGDRVRRSCCRAAVCATYGPGPLAANQRTSCVRWALASVRPSHRCASLPHPWKPALTCANTRPVPVRCHQRDGEDRTASRCPGRAAVARHSAGVA